MPRAAARRCPQSAASGPRTRTGNPPRCLLLSVERRDLAAITRTVTDPASPRRGSQRGGHGTSSPMPRRVRGGHAYGSARADTGRRRRIGVAGATSPVHGDADERESCGRGSAPVRSVSSRLGRVLRRRPPPHDDRQSRRLREQPAPSRSLSTPVSLPAAPTLTIVGIARVEAGCVTASGNRPSLDAHRLHLADLLQWPVTISRGAQPPEVTSRLRRRPVIFR